MTLFSVDDRERITTLIDLYEHFKCLWERQNKVIEKNLYQRYNGSKDEDEKKLSKK